MFTIRALHTSDIQDCYLINAESHKEFDENLDMYVLHKSFPTEHEFETLLKLSNTRAIIYEEKRKNGKVLINEPKGFAIYSVEINNNHSIFNILAVESSVKDDNILKDLILDIIRRAKKSKLPVIIYHSISEKKLNMVKLDYELGFCKEKIIFNQNGPDIIVMKLELQNCHLTKEEVVA